ncbi:sigma-70 family RNA polymerase sigma factor [Arthrobacter sp.]|uniref:RNA polymerase sigma factor n=1 Tax=Arthrobacter sp. TaxID=1667 RepID=UPI0028114846|nr:sigma-70 family RNA polymerase sigma factor [Arthrobacter sp.]
MTVQNYGAVLPWEAPQQDRSRFHLGSVIAAAGKVPRQTDKLIPGVSEARLIMGVRSGEPAAMAQLYERHRVQGLQFARSLLNSSEDAEDILHEAFTKAVSAIRNGFGPTDTFGPYLSTCVRSVVNSLWTKRAQESTSCLSHLDAEAVEDPALETILSVFEHENIAAAMRSLPERWRTVLWHAEVMGEPPRNIAPLLGIEPNAVSALLIRARAGLRAAYELQSRPDISTSGRDQA